MPCVTNLFSFCPFRLLINSSTKTFFSQDNEMKLPFLTQASFRAVSCLEDVSGHWTTETGSKYLNQDTLVNYEHFNSLNYS